MRSIRLIIVITAAVALTACLRTYKIDVQQGNVVSQKEVSQLERGMTKREVRYVMGTPLVIDPFHNNRWDYFYSFKAGGSSEPEQRRIALVFVHDRLDHIDGDVAPTQDELAVDTESEYVASGTRVTEPTKKEKKGFFKRIWDKITP